MNCILKHIQVEYHPVVVYDVTKGGGTMKPHLKNIVSVTQSNQNLSVIDMTEEEKIDFVAACILKEHKAAFLELAK